MNQLKKLFVTSLIAFVTIFANANEPSHPVPLKPVRGGLSGGPSRPICIPFSCSYNAGGILLSSTANLSAVVEVVNGAGEVVAEVCGCLNPELIIPIDDFSSPLTIYIVVNEMTYIGYIE